VTKHYGRLLSLCLVGCALAAWSAMAAGEETSSRETSVQQQPSAPEVIEQLRTARENLTPLEAEFTWVMGSVGADQLQLPGRIYVKDYTHYRIDYEFPDQAGSYVYTVLLPDGKWLYQFVAQANAVGSKFDLDYMKRKVRDPRARIGFDGPGTVLLEYLQQRGFVTSEGDAEVNGELCAVLSYEGTSLRKPFVEKKSSDPTVVNDVLTKLYFRKSDGLLIGEETYDIRGDLSSRYRVSNIQPIKQWSLRLLAVPPGVYCVDLTRQQVRRLLYGPPPAAPVYEEALPMPRMKRPQ